MVPVAEGVGVSKIFVINLFIVVKVILVQLQILLSWGKSTIYTYNYLAHSSAASKKEIRQS